MSTEIAGDVWTRLDLERALRGVATLAARGADPDELFSAMTQAGCAELLGLVGLSLFAWDESTAMLTKVAGSRSMRGLVPNGTKFSADDFPLTSVIMRNVRPMRSQWHPKTREDPDRLGQAVGAPVVVDGAIWGVVAGKAEPSEGQVRLDCEQWLAEFAGLMATTISNARRRDEAGALAESQGALRRVATLVAENADPQDVFAAVATEAAGILGVGAVSLIRWDAGTGLFTKIFGTHGDRASVPDGGSWPIEDCPEGELILRTGGAVRIDDWTHLPGPVVARHVAGGFGQGVAAPVVLDGVIWGHVAGFGEAGDVLAPGSESKLADFTALMAIAIANSAAREELRGLAVEHGSALRRVATLVAQRALPSEVFTAIAREAARALNVTRVEVSRYLPDGSVELLGAAGPGSAHLRDRLASAAAAVAAEIRCTKGAVRIELDAGIAEVTGHGSIDGGGVVVGVPILLDGTPWGSAAILAEGRLDGDAELRLADFTALLASLIANVQARDDLMASRARIVVASDEARRRIERNLHDGIQQRVVSLALSLRAVRVRHTVPSEVKAALDEFGRDLDSLLAEIQTFSHGLHPVLLTRYGLGPSLQDLSRRAPFIVDVDVLEDRLPEAVETGIYYVICEALANTTKHARASTVSISVSRTESGIRAVVVDDGIGGAVIGGGSGLVGLMDRVEALGGQLDVDSVPGLGTRLTADIPLMATTSSVLPPV